MKKPIALILIAVIMLSLAACGESGNNKSFTKQNSVEDVLNNGGAPTEAPTSPPTEKETSSVAPMPGVDVDLAALSPSLVYGEVSNMIVNPDAYVGKSVRMMGTFSTSEYEGKRYYACIIKDATACCANGIEFVWAGDHSYPADYPAVDTEITVIGNFDVYYEGETRYIQLIDSTLSF